MTKLRRGVLALAVGAFAALAPITPNPVTPAHATGTHGKATLTGERTCRADGTWTATFTFTNHHPRKQAVITAVKGALDPQVPIVVAPGARVSDTTAPRAAGQNAAHLSVTFHWRSPNPASPPQITLPPAPQPPADGPAVQGRVGAERTKGKTLHAVVRNRCPQPTTTPTTSPTATPPPPPPTTTTPTSPPTTTVPPSSSPPATPSEAPEPSETAPTPPSEGEGGGSLPLTGPGVGYAVAGGAVLTAAGVAVVVLLRRRRTTFTA